jgi:hypothetical protein
MMRFVIAALRWLQPTATTDTWFVQGFVSPKGLIKVSTFSAQAGAAMVPQFASRPQHIFLEDFETRYGLANPHAFGGVSVFLPEFERIVQERKEGR